MTIVRKVGRLLDKYIAYLGYVGLGMGRVSIIIMMLIIVMNVIMRYFFNKPMLFIEELSGYGMVLLVYMGFAFTARVQGHIRVEFLVRRLPKRARDGLDVVTSVMTLALIGLYFWYAWGLWVGSLLAGQRSVTSLSAPLYIPQSFLCIGMGLLGLEVAAQIVKKFVDFLKGLRKAASQDVLGRPDEYRA